jgi:cell division protein FtsX
MEKIKTIYGKIKNIVNYYEYTFDFNLIKFWNMVYNVFFVATILLAFMSMFSANLLEVVSNPIKNSSNTTLIIEIHPELSKERTLNKQIIVSQYLKTQKNIKTFNVISENELVSYIDNFRGDFKNQFNKIPLPVIIVAELYEYNQDELQNLRLALSQKVKNVYVDTQQELIVRLSKPISLAKLVVSIIPALTILILMGMVSLIIYTIIITNKETIEILLSLGLFKKDLQKDFTFWIFYKTLQSCLFSGFITIIILLLLKYILFFNFDYNLLINYGLLIVSSIILLPVLSAFLTNKIVNKIIDKNF